MIFDENREIKIIIMIKYQAKQWPFQKKNYLTFQEIYFYFLNFKTVTLMKG